MWLGVLFNSFFLLTLPASIVALLRGRWSLLVPGLIGFGAVVPCISESCVFPFWLGTSIWTLGLVLLLIAVMLPPRPASWWDRRFGSESALDRHWLVWLAAMLPVVWFGFFLSAGLLPGGRQDDLVRPTSGLAGQFADCMEEAGHDVFNVELAPHPVTGDLEVVGWGSDEPAPESVIVRCRQP